MSCEACDDAWESNEIYPFREGNKELGWGTIGIIGCTDHVALTMKKLARENREQTSEAEGETQEA